MSSRLRQLRQQAKSQFENPYKVGDILHHSWGYDQTNCDFYQVVEVKTASVVLRKIAHKTVPGSEGFMCESVMPVKDAFIEKGTQALTKIDHAITPQDHSIKKRVCFYVQEGGQMRYYISVPYGWCSLWDGKSCYSSWYA